MWTQSLHRGGGGRRKSAGQAGLAARRMDDAVSEALRVGHPHGPQQSLPLLDVNGVEQRRLQENDSLPLTNEGAGPRIPLVPLVSSGGTGLMSYTSTPCTRYVASAWS